ncbi:MAG: PTS sugar transporter subunit IIA, partial [Phycisphaerales bacterium]|nr:PTS sugar transporter subunit IIA [Phycisphaerales bacterium]
HPTSTPEGVAFPHAMLPAIKKTIIIPAILRPPVDFGVRSHPAASLIFCMFGDSNEPFSHVRLLARLARIAHSPGALDRLRAATDAADLYSILVAEDRAHG